MAARKEIQYLDKLGLEEGSSEEDIKKAYKKLALDCHPDKHPDDPNATEKFQELSEAYTYLMKDEISDDEDGFYEEDIVLIDLLRFFSFTRGAGSYRRGSGHSCNCGQCTRSSRARIIRTPSGIIVVESESEDDEWVPKKDKAYSSRYKENSSNYDNFKVVPEELTKNDNNGSKKKKNKKGKGAKKDVQKNGNNDDGNAYNSIDKEYIVDPDSKGNNAQAKEDKSNPQPEVVQSKKKSKKELLQEQKKRDKEMAEIAAKLEEKKAQEAERLLKIQEKEKQKREALNKLTVSPPSKKEETAESSSGKGSIEKELPNKTKVDSKDDSKKSKSRRKREAKQRRRKGQTAENTSSGLKIDEPEPETFDDFSFGNYNNTTSKVDGDDDWDAPASSAPQSSFGAANWGDPEPSKPTRSGFGKPSSSAKIDDFSSSNKDWSAPKNSYDNNTNSGGRYNTKAPKTFVAPRFQRQYEQKQQRQQETFKPKPAPFQQNPVEDSWDSGTNQGVTPISLYDPAPAPPTKNVWSERKEFFSSALPADETEEEAMLRAALELSKLQAEEEELQKKMEEENDVLLKKAEARRQRDAEVQKSKEMQIQRLQEDVQMHNIGRSNSMEKEMIADEKTRWQEQFVAKPKKPFGQKFPEKKSSPFGSLDNISANTNNMAPIMKNGGLGKGNNPPQKEYSTAMDYVHPFAAPVKNRDKLPTSKATTGIGNEIWDDNDDHDLIETTKSFDSVIRKPDPITSLKKESSPIIEEWDKGVEYQPPRPTVDNSFITQTPKPSIASVVIEPPLAKDFSSVIAKPDTNNNNTKKAQPLKEMWDTGVKPSVEPMPQEEPVSVPSTAPIPRRLGPLKKRIQGLDNPAPSSRPARFPGFGKAPNASVSNSDPNSTISMPGMKPMENVITTASQNIKVPPLPGFKASSAVYPQAQYVPQTQDTKTWDNISKTVGFPSSGQANTSISNSTASFPVPNTTGFPSGGTYMPPPLPGFKASLPPMATNANPPTAEQVPSFTSINRAPSKPAVTSSTSWADQVDDVDDVPVDVMTLGYGRSMAASQQQDLDDKVSPVATVKPTLLPENSGVENGSGEPARQTQDARPAPGFPSINELTSFFSYANPYAAAAAVPGTAPYIPYMPYVPASAIHDNPPPESASSNGSNQNNANTSDTNNANKQQVPHHPMMSMFPGFPAMTMMPVPVPMMPAAYPNPFMGIPAVPAQPRPGSRGAGGSNGSGLPKQTQSQEQGNREQ